ncbi:MAG: LON peptidase substrate-binding domain-containing protein [Planctomycetes bacterium]|nr:LON peptidase substrate-binding domain-containing protein [Planctomycetota bacterium]
MPDSTLQIPIFPLNIPLFFPGRALPLHIFEMRYRALIRDALAGNRRFAMAVFRPGWETDYEGRPPVYPTVCIGSIVKYNELPDGRFLLLLNGEARARLESECNGKPYRVGTVSIADETPLTDCENKEWKLKLEAAFYELCSKKVLPLCGPNVGEPRESRAIEIAEETILSLPIPIEKKMCLYSTEGQAQRIARVHQAIREYIETRALLNKPRDGSSANN